MRRNIDRFRIEFQHNFQKIMAVQPQDGTPIGVNVADRFQFSCQTLSRLQPWEQNHTVHFPHPVVFLVNGTDLSCNHKARRS